VRRRSVVRTPGKCEIQTTHSVSGGSSPSGEPDMLLCNTSSYRDLESVTDWSVKLKSFRLILFTLLNLFNGFIVSLTLSHSH